ncbi:unnamed protein product [Cuscuta epithymum]|uniref:Dof-type domain-containing protein n=1 Tax=Cuscuta epithymum TaxID=186058 RepID=A0AAV0F7Z3_9ASTE|nr:unnamed protein product [Cuscuta epithymum]
MSAAKDPAAIKLFGKTISPCWDDGMSCSADRSASKDNKIISLKLLESKEGNEDDDEHGTANSYGKETQCKKQRDAIIPCPRCKSKFTKFCYYNNYNVNQPRHFCKNCQRYWTAGGSMRNVPVGSGRRKSKSSSSSEFLHRIMHSEQPFHGQFFYGSPIHQLVLAPSNGLVMGHPCWISAPTSMAMERHYCYGPKGDDTLGLIKRESTY